MTHQDGPSEAIRSLIESYGGQIWTKTTDTVAGGTGLDEADINATYEIPGKAKTLLGARGIVSPGNIAVAESIQNVFIIQGENYNYGPQEFLGPNAPAILKDGVHLISPPEWYPINAPINGGQQIQLSQEPLDSLAGNSRVGMELTFTDLDLRSLGVPVIRSKCSREVAIDGAGISNGTTLTLDKVSKIIELGAVIFTGAHTLEEDFQADLIIKSTSLKIQEVRCMLAPIVAILDGTTDNGNPLGVVNRRTQSIISEERLITVTSDFDLDVDVTNAGAGAHMIRYV